MAVSTLRHLVVVAPAAAALEQPLPPTERAAYQRQLLADFLVSRRATSSPTTVHATLSALRATVHLGAHADGPNHYGAGQPGIGERSLEYYIGPCQVVDAPEHTSSSRSPEITRTRSGWITTRGYSAWKAGAYQKCTVASWPSKRPVSASRKIPEQAEQSMAPPSCMRRSHCTSRG